MGPEKVWGAKGKLGWLREKAEHRFPGYGAWVKWTLEQCGPVTGLSGEQWEKSGEGEEMVEEFGVSGTLM